jgi:hypothetical protein
MTASNRVELRAIHTSPDIMRTGREEQLAPRHGLAGRPLAGRCRRCGHPVVGCRTAIGAVVAVDPRPVPGGELLINPSTDSIVAVRNRSEALSARRRGEIGFVPHDRVCPRLRHNTVPPAGGSYVGCSAS